MNVSESLLKAILGLVGRQAISPAEVAKIVAPQGKGTKQVVAYNLCDGKTPQSEIVKKAKLDRGNFSRTVARWIEAGIVMRIGEEQHPLHIYPLSSEAIKHHQKVGRDV
jgi:hypothetical protein